jgi:hypothetical protein
MNLTEFDWSQKGSAASEHPIKLTQWILESDSKVVEMVRRLVRTDPHSHYPIWGIRVGSMIFR